MSTGRNPYTCEGCGYVIITEHVDDGVTPAFLGCQNPKVLARTVNSAVTSKTGCGAFMRSHWYPRAVVGTTTHEWYRPADLSTLSAGERDHVERGGVLLRAKDGAL